MRNETHVCATCGSHRVEYGPLVDTGEEVYYPLTCQDCGAKSEERYDLIHVGTYAEGEETIEDQNS